MNHKYIVSLVFVGGLLSLSSLKAAHPIDTSVGQKVVADYEKLPDDKTRRFSIEQDEFLNKLKSSAETAEERHAAHGESKKVAQAEQVKSCVTFLRRFPYYPSELKEAQPILDKVDPKGMPSFASPYKMLNMDCSKLTSEQAWQLFECEPCKKVYEECLNEDRSFNKEKAKDIERKVSLLSNSKFEDSELQHSIGRRWIFFGDFVATTGVKTTPIESEKLIPLDVHNKALVAENCLKVFTLKQAASERAKGIDKYLKEDK